MVPNRAMHHIFDEDLAWSKQKSSVEGFLLHLLSLTINGDTGFKDLSDQAKQVTANLWI